MTQNVIVAVDPGPHTGIAVKLPDGTRVAQMIHNNAIAVWNYILKLGPDVLIVEQWVGTTTRAVSTDGLYTIQMAGSLFSLAHCISLSRPPNRKCELVLQTPGMRSSFLPLAKEALRKGHTLHERDALAHLLLWEYKNLRGGDVQFATSHSTPVARVERIIAGRESEQEAAIEPNGS